MKSASPVSSEPHIYCKQCGYDLRGNITPVCPECGKGFDSADPRTFAPHPPRPWLWRWTKLGLAALLSVMVLLGAAWGWLYWGWYEEQKLLEQLGERDLMFIQKCEQTNSGAFPICARICRKVAPVGGEAGAWVQKKNVPLGFVFYRTQSLYLPDKTTDDLFITVVTKMKELKSLDIRCTQVTDAGLAHLKELPGLHRLLLNGDHVTDASLKNLIELKELELLSLTCPQVTDAGLDYLEGMHNLKTLFLSKTKVTPAGVRNLKAALPNIKYISPCDLPRR